MKNQKIVSGKNLNRGPRDKLVAIKPELPHVDNRQSWVVASPLDRACVLCFTNPHPYQASPHHAFTWSAWLICISTPAQHCIFSCYQFTSVDCTRGGFPSTGECCAVYTWAPWSQAEGGWLIELKLVAEKRENLNGLNTLPHVLSKHSNIPAHAEILISMHSISGPNMP